MHVHMHPLMFSKQGGYNGIMRDNIKPNIVIADQADIVSGVTVPLQLLPVYSQVICLYISCNSESAGLPITDSCISGRTEEFVLTSSYFGTDMTKKMKGCDFMPNPLIVNVENGDIEKAFKNLKKKMALEGIFKELKRRRYFEKPSQEKKRKREEAERRRLKKMRRLAAQNRQRKIAASSSARRSSR